MAEPLPPFLGAGERVLPMPTRPRWHRRAWRAVRGCLRDMLGGAVTGARLVPGLGAVGCAVAGTWLLWGLGWALLAAVPFLLLIDARTPRG
jgi:hypothetical protein